MANPFGADTVDYGTVSGHSSGFRGDDDLEEIGNLVREIQQSTQNLRYEKNKVGTSSDTEDFRGRIQGLLRKTLRKIQAGDSMLKHLKLSKNPQDVRRVRGLAIKSLEQSMSSAINEFQEVSQGILRSMENAGDPFRTKTPLATSVTLSDTAEIDQDDTARLIRGGQSNDQILRAADDATYLEERAERMEQLQDDISALNDIMVDIGTLVTTQGEQIDNIEGNVEDAYNDVSRGNQQLEKGLRLKKCSRKLSCCIGIVVGVILLIIIIIIIIIIAKFAGKKDNN